MNRGQHAACFSPSLYPGFFAVLVLGLRLGLVSHLGRD